MKNKPYGWVRGSLFTMDETIAEQWGRNGAEVTPVCLAEDLDALTAQMEAVGAGGVSSERLT